MNDTPDAIRREMEETKSQLSEKLESLETQVSDSIQSTGSAVTATAEAVQETVETVTEAFHEAAESVSHAFDVRRQFGKHPILILGGAAVLGYLAVEFLTTPKKPPADLAPVPQPVADTLEHATHTASSAVTTELAANQTVPYGSIWNQLKEVGVAALISVVQDLAARTVPSVVDYLAGDRPDDRRRTSQQSLKMPRAEWLTKPADTAQRLQIAMSDRSRNGHSF